MDSDAINRTILAASSSGGGIVSIPKGRYICFSIRLQNNVALRFDAGAVIEAADPNVRGAHYDLPENDADLLYQDFGHSHWRNSLIWGDGIENVVIEGPGLIDGADALTRNGPGAHWEHDTGERPLSMSEMTAEEIARLEPAAEAMRGIANKAIALKNARNIRLSGFTISQGGHFAVLVTGGGNIVIEDIRIDTQRDGINLDCVKGARISRCRINSPNDDAIVLKSTCALGRAIATEDILIEDCTVSGYDLGTMLSGEFGRTQQQAPDRDPMTGRIKCGTESNGGFRKIRVKNCCFARSRGLTLTIVDGGVMEDIAVCGLEMDEITTAPFFLRLGDRRRGPPGTGVGAIRRVQIEGLTAKQIAPNYAAAIVGLSGHAIEDIELRDIHLCYRESSLKAAPSTPPEVAEAYPESTMFGPTPASAFWARHVNGLTVDGFSIEQSGKDPRPLIVLENARNISAVRAPDWLALLSEKTQ